MTPVRHSHDPLGTTRGFAFILSDVTEEVKARNELERIKAELESFIASMADGVILFGVDGVIKLINHAGRRILGMPNEEFPYVRLDHKFYDMDGNALTTEDTAAMRALQGEHVRDFHYRVITPWGRECYISASAAPVKDAEGRIIGATDIIRDVSERVKFEQQRESLFIRERRIAEVLQQALVPPRVDFKVPGCKIAVNYEPALAKAEVGGDFYDVFELKEGKFGVLIGDVAGKGLATAIRVSAARYAIRSYAYLDSSPGLVLTLANDALSKEKDGLAMLTIFFAVLDITKGTLMYANGGHESPLVRDADGNVEELYLSGRALGILGGFTYPEAVRQLKPGDVVVITTDGITEARRGPNMFFGTEGVADYLKKNRQAAVHDILGGLLNAAKEYAGANMHDDVAIVAIECGR